MDLPADFSQRYFPDASHGTVVLECPYSEPEGCSWGEGRDDLLTYKVHSLPGLVIKINFHHYLGNRAFSWCDVKSLH